MSLEAQSKVTVLLAVKNEQKRSELEMSIMTQLHDISVFAVSDVDEYQLSIQKNPPQLVLTDAEFLAGNPVLKDGVSHPDRVFTAFIVFGSYPKKEDFLDELMLGKVQFFDAFPDDEQWKLALKKAFKFCLESKTAAFQIKLLKANEHLMKVGDPASTVYILKRGQLQAYQIGFGGEKTILGDIAPGEFVGEMAYFNSEPRAANVIALSDVELVEIPIASFDRVLYQKPAWAMKLIETLSKRLKKFIQKS